MFRKIYHEVMAIKRQINAISEYIAAEQRRKEDIVVKGSICQTKEFKANGETVKKVITIQLDAEEWYKLRKQYFYHEMKAYIEYLEKEREG